MESSINKEEHCVLFVGEGDFSFSSTYILSNQHNQIKEKVYATCLCTGSLTNKQHDNIKKILQHGGFVYTDVDATKLECHAIMKDVKFNKIVFNFPHIPGKMNIRKNRDLVQQFFISAEKLIYDDGSVWVTLCQGQGGTEIENISRQKCDTWQIVALAASANLILHDVMPFDAKQFESYECTGFRGQDKPFRTKGALVHIFQHGKSDNDALMGGESKTNLVSFESLSKRFEALQRRMEKNLSMPNMKILSDLITFNRSFVNLQITMNDLLVCKNLPSLSLKSASPNLGSIDFCESCLKKLSLSFVNNKNSDCIISVACNVCCVKNISVNLHPLSHILTYFSCKTECIFEILCKLLEHLNSKYCFNRSSYGSDNISISNEEILRTGVENVELSVGDEKIKNILYIFAIYEINKGNELLYYSNVNFILSSNDSYECEMYSRKVGNVIQCYDNSLSYICILFNLDVLACLKYHVMDYRILFVDDAYYHSYDICGYQQEVFRANSVFPPTYVHDISFYTEDDYSETEFIIVILSLLNFSIKKVTLLESYKDSINKRQSKCYRFIYQSYHEALSKEKVNVFHTQVVRKSLQNSLNITLR